MAPSRPHSCAARARRDHAGRTGEQGGQPDQVRGDHDPAVRRRRPVAADPVDGDVVVGEGDGQRERGSPFPPPSTTTQPTPAAANSSTPAPDSTRRSTSRARVPSPGTVRPPMSRSPVVSTSADTQRGSGSSTGAVTGPREVAHALCGQHRDRSRIGVDQGGRRRPTRRIAHGGDLAADAPREVGQDGHQRQAAHRRRRRPAAPGAASVTTADAPATA